MNLNVKKWGATLSFAWLLLLSNNVFAGNWTGWYGLQNIFTNTDGTVYLMLDPHTAHPNPDNCVSTLWLRIVVDQPNAKDMYQMALTAKAAGLRVNIYVDGCAGSYARALSMRVL